MDCKSTQRILLLVLLVAGVCTGCQDPLERLKFQHGEKTVDKYESKFLGGKGTLQVYGYGFYDDTGDEAIHIRITWAFRYPRKTEGISFHPGKIRAFMGNQMLLIEGMNVDTSEIGKGKQRINHRFICPPCWNIDDATVDPKAAPRGDLIALDISELVLLDGHEIITDTIYAVVPERVQMWVHRLSPSNTE